MVVVTWGSGRRLEGTLDRPGVYPTLWSQGGENHEGIHVIHELSLTLLRRGLSWHHLGARPLARGRGVDSVRPATTGQAFARDGEPRLRQDTGELTFGTDLG